MTPVDLAEDAVLHSNWAAVPCTRFQVGELRLIEYFRLLGKYQSLYEFQKAYLFYYHILFYYKIFISARVLRISLLRRPTLDPRTAQRYHKEVGSSLFYNFPQIELLEYCLEFITKYESYKPPVQTA